MVTSKLQLVNLTSCGALMCVQQCCVVLSVAVFSGSPHGAMHTYVHTHSNAATYHTLLCYVHSYIIVHFVCIYMWYIQFVVPMYSTVQNATGVCTYVLLLV